MLALDVICRPQPTFILDEPNGGRRIEGTSITKPFHHGARISDQCLTGIQVDEITMHIQRGIYLPFKDQPWTDSAAGTVLETLVWFIRNQVVPRFEPFFEQRREGSVLFARR